MAYHQPKKKKEWPMDSCLHIIKDRRLIAPTTSGNGHEMLTRTKSPISSIRKKNAKPLQAEPYPHLPNTFLLFFFASKYISFSCSFAFGVNFVFICNLPKCQPC